MNVSTPDTRAAVLACLERMRTAWDTGDATAFAAEFTDDAVYVIFVGVEYRGREAIRAGHVPVFEKWQRGSRMSLRVLDLRLVADDVAVVLTEGGIGKGSRIRHDKMQTYTLVRTGGAWQCTAFQNTKRNRLFVALNAREEKRLAA